MFSKQSERLLDPVQESVPNKSVLLAQILKQRPEDIESVPMEMDTPIKQNTKTVKSRGAEGNTSNKQQTDNATTKEKLKKQVRIRITDYVVTKRIQTKGVGRNIN